MKHVPYPWTGATDPLFDCDSCWLDAFLVCALLIIHFPAFAAPLLGRHQDEGR